MKKKHLLGLKDLSAAEITEILDRAAAYKKHAWATKPLSGKSVITLFYENSTRTKLSFELAAKNLGAGVSGMAASASSVSKGESLIDTGRTLDALGVDAIVLRHPMSGAPHLLDKNIKARVINGGDGSNEHPTQALLDMLTMREKFGNLKGLTVALCGDILHSRVARSNIWGLKTMGADVRVVGPQTLLPSYAEQAGCKAYTDLDKAVDGANVVMGLRLQLERQKSALFPGTGEYSQFYGLTAARFEKAAKNAIIMHPGPTNRDLEIDGAVADCSASMIDIQVTNGVAVRMAVLEGLCSN